VRDGRAMALVKNLPREGVTPAEFRLMTWAIGLHFGVARPQNRTSDYITEVKDTGHAYRSPTGRGYNSNAELDFHVDSSDVVLLSCYNQAPVGGMSMCASAATAYEIVQAERPDYAAALATKAGAPLDLASGQAMMQKDGCAACHAVDKTIVGPAYNQVAAKYRGDKTAAAKLEQKVKTGGAGVWGPVPMPPNTAVPDADIKALVSWILSLK